MCKGKYLESLRDVVVALDLDRVKNVVETALKHGISPIEAIINGLGLGLEIVGEKFEKGEYFLSELIVAAEVAKEGMTLILPHIEQDKSAKKDRVILATVEGDNHDIGKSLVATLLDVSGFEVIDLGVDVSSNKIVEAVRKYAPRILGLSALLTTTMPEMGNVISDLERVGLRNTVKVIVGGSPVTQEFAEKIGADYRAKDAIDGMNKCKEWVSKERG